MTDLITSLKQWRAAVGADIKALTAAQGSLAALTTTTKLSLVAAINELKTSIAGLSGGSGGAAIDDTASDTSHTWSASKIAAYVAAQATATQNAILGGASAAYDTLLEIQTALQSEDTAISGLLTAMSNRLRFDAAQTLTNAQKTQAGQNLGIGDPVGVDFLADYTADKA